MKYFYLLIVLVVLAGCSGEKGGGVIGNSSSSSVIPASQIETTKLQEAIKAEPTYKIDDSEITLLQNEGILTEAELAQLQAIQ